MNEQTPRAIRPRVRHGIAVVLAYSLLYVVFFAPALLSGRLLAPGDARELLVPHYYSPRTLWAADLFSGFPAMGDPIHMLWYPPAFLLSAIPNSWNVFVLAAYVLASCFTCGYVYLLTRCRFGALVGGAVYGLSGFFMSHLGHTNVIHSAAWMPLLLWALEQLRQRVSVGWVAVGAIAVAGSALAGHPQFFFYALLLGACYVLCLGRRAPAGTVAYGLASMGSVLLGLGLCAILLLPMLELQGQSMRAALPYREFVSFNLPVQELPRLLLPWCCGGCWNPLTHTVCPDFSGGGGVCEATGYVGLLPLLLAVYGFALGTSRPVARFWLAVAIVATMLALGPRTPLPYALYWLPGYNQFRIPARHFVHAALAVSILAGMGVAGLARLDGAARRHVYQRGALIGGSILAACLAFFLLGFVQGWYTRDLPAELQAQLTVPTWHIPALIVPMTVFAIGLAGLWAWCRWPGMRTRSCLVAVLVLDLGSFGWLCEWQHDFMSQESLRMPAQLTAYRNTLRTTGQRLLPMIPPIRREAAPPDRSRLWRLPCVTGYSPLALTRYGQMLGIGYTGVASLQCLEEADQSLDLLCGRYVLAPRPSTNAPSTAVARLNAAPERWIHREDWKHIAVYENRRSLPRAWLVHRVLAMEADAILQAIHGSQLPTGEPYDPRQVALVEDAGSLQPGGRDGDGKARLLHGTDTEVVIQTSCPTPAFLVLSDTYYPGWQASINDQPAPILRTNYILRGVYIPAGSHIVRFEFRPWSFYLGAALTACAGVAIVILLVWQAVSRLGIKSLSEKGV